MARVHESFPFDLVLMLGDNFYGPQGPADLENKFARPYRPLLDAGVTFRAALGNHDDLATDQLSADQHGRAPLLHLRPAAACGSWCWTPTCSTRRSWPGPEPRSSRPPNPGRSRTSTIPLYGNAGRHGSNVDLRVLLEPVLLQFGVQVVFSGHDHVYERLKPQRGIHYFVAGSGGQLRKGDLQAAESTAAGFDQDQAFMLVEISGDDLSLPDRVADGRDRGFGRDPPAGERIGS